MKVVIIGAGIGGLVCAISCRREGLEVVVLEQAPALQPVSAIWMQREAGKLKGPLIAWVL